MVQATQQVSAVPQGEKEEAALVEFRKRLELKPDVEKQLRAGGEPGRLSDMDPSPPFIVVLKQCRIPEDRRMLEIKRCAPA